MILAMKTAADDTQLWLFASSQSDQAEAEFSWHSGRNLADELLDRLTAFTEHHGGLSALSGIVIFSGPGSFTSLRIGHTMANALADSLGIPVAGTHGNDWQPVGLAALDSIAPGHWALPYYGADPNISQPKT